MVYWTLMIRNAINSCISLHHILTQEALVSSIDEATAIIESAIQENDSRFSTGDGDSRELSAHEGFCRYVLCEYFGLSNHDATRVLDKYPLRNRTTNKNETNYEYGGDGVRNTDFNVEEECETNANLDDDDGREEVVGPGECELCERDVAKLTRHHLIPKSTWKRTEPMILSRWNRAVEVPSKMIHSGDAACDELDHLVPILLKMSAAIPSCETLHGRQSAAGRRIIRDLLNHQTIDICRPCHNHIHRSYDNRTLSMQFNTLDKLLNDPTISKYAKWASRQHRFKIR